MSNAYRAVQWNPHKRAYDLILLGAVLGYLAIFVGAGSILLRADRAVDLPILLVRATGIGAIILLHVVLCIGPLARIDRRVAPLLYNRRHLGVSFFLIASIHALLATLFYGGFGNRNPLSAVVAGYSSYAFISGFPFEVLGFIALLVFFLMAATSHDFWLHNLSPRTWKNLHMLVYPAYALVIMHVVFGALRSEPHPLYLALLAVGVCSVIAAHLTAGLREWRKDAVGTVNTEPWVAVADLSELIDGRAKVICLKDAERVAVFRHGDTLSALSNVCAHQGGPLGEGRIIDGCITCPWHGYQYLPHNGESPPPFTEKVPTYELRIRGTTVELNPRPNPPGFAVRPVQIHPPAPKTEPHGA